MTARLAAALRRLLRLPPTIADCMYAAHRAAPKAEPQPLWSGNPPTAPNVPITPENTLGFTRAIAEAPCEPLHAPDLQAVPDPYRGIVSGPQLVDRTRHNHAQHVARWDGPRDAA